LWEIFITRNALPPPITYNVQHTYTSIRKLSEISKISFQINDLRVEEHVLEAGGRRRAEKDLLREEQVHSRVVEHVLEAGGHRRAV
jgi:hypothetical protein